MTSGPVVAPVTAGKPRGTTQVVTRGLLMIRWQVRGTVHPRWQYEVAENVKWQYEVATDGQSEHDTCHSRRFLCVSPSRRVSVRGNHVAIMRRLVDGIKTKIPSDLVILNGLDIEMQKKEHILMEEKYLAVSQQPEDSLIMGDEHLDTILEKESDELIKSSVENLVPIPSESEVTFDNESECDMPDVPMENFKIYSNPLFDDEEIISPKIDPHYFNVESNLMESLLNRDILIDSSPKFDYLLEEFSGELAHIDPIPPGIEKADFDLEEEIRLVENLLYDNSSPRLPEELNLEIADTILESLSPSLILVEDSDSLMEEIDLFLATNDSMPPGIKDDDYDSEGDIRFLEELQSIDPLPLPEIESSNLDHFNDPSSPRPPPEPPDVEICFDFEPDAGVVTTKV
ncbi:hypothetical protein Tco_0371894 [Tanacetum coccineum]